MQYKDQEIEVTVKRVRALRLSVKPDGRLTLTIPIGMSDETVMRFLDAHYQWMVRTRAKVKERAAAQLKLQYTTGEQHLLWGKRLPLFVQPEQGNEYVEFCEDKIILYIHPDRTREQRRKILYQGYYQVFKPVLDDMMKKWEERLTDEMSFAQRLIDPKRYREIQVSIRLMRTEWGSCTPKKKHMTMNVDMVRLPRECMEYVVVHEFTHIDHCNHSPAFWALCDKRLASAGLADSKTQRAIMRALTKCGGEI